jgi:hypothetical protein
MNQLERCPWCGGEITHEKFLEIEARIRADEERKATASQLNLKKTLEAGFSTRLETTVQARLREQRTLLDGNYAKELAKRDGQHKRDIEKLQAQLKDLGRRLEKKTAHELGEVEEIDLFERLREEFPDDKFRRVQRGEPGADIHQTVFDRDQPSGLIIFDSKNHRSWRNEFASKLRQDQLAAKADHAVLSTSVFPTGHKELCVMNDVIVVSPQRATHVVRLMREAIISLHRKGLSQEHRQTKVEQLYRLITSADYAKRLGEALRLSDAILNLDVDEQKQHQRTWKTRGTLATTLGHTLRAIDDDVARILSGEGTDELAAANHGDDAEVPF